jgi:hypothetical protein
MTGGKPQMTIRAMVGLSILAVAIVADTAHAASTSPGKTAVYASTAAAVITDPPAPVLTATIAKGKKKRVLEVDLSAIVTGGPSGAGKLTLVPIVNGLAIMEPVDTGSTVASRLVCGSAPEGCSLSAQYWLDLDAAEAAHPGVFIKQPLVIEGRAGWGSFGGPPIPPVSAAVSLRARVQKN